MSRPPTYDDANLIVKLYELRREPRMRQARDWFARSFHAATLEEVQKLFPPGSEENASFRMVTSYWDMAASFVANGILHAELFYQSNQELLFVYERIRQLLPQAREASKNPMALQNLETVAQGHLRWLEKGAPEFYPIFSERVRNLVRPQPAQEPANVPPPFPTEDDQAH
jgi:hypothetical protein